MCWAFEKWYDFITVGFRRKAFFHLVILLLDFGVISISSELKEPIRCNYLLNRLFKHLQLYSLMHLQKDATYLKDTWKLLFDNLIKWLRHATNYSTEVIQLIPKTQI